MKYDHVVKVGGVFYAAGQEVPNGKQEKAEQKPAPAPVPEPAVKEDKMPKQKKGE